MSCWPIITCPSQSNLNGESEETSEEAQEQQQQSAPNVSQLPFLLEEPSRRGVGYSLAELKVESDLSVVFKKFSSVV